MYFAIYFAIGFILTMLWWLRQYNEEYERLKYQGEAQDAMAMIFMLFLIVLWPFKLFNDFIEYIQNKFHNL